MTRLGCIANCSSPAATEPEPVSIHPVTMNQIHLPSDFTTLPLKRLHPRLVGLEGQWLKIAFCDGTSVTMLLESCEWPLHRGRVGGQLFIIDPEQCILLVELLESPITDEPAD